MANMEQWTLINYFDVWGNKEEGWEINNLCKDGTIELPENRTRQQILDALIEADFIVDHATLEDVRIEDYSGDIIEFWEEATNYPLGRLEPVRD